jgi:hypothetical protein
MMRDRENKEDEKMKTLHGKKKEDSAVYFVLAFFAMGILLMLGGCAKNPCGPGVENVPPIIENTPEVTPTVEATPTVEVTISPTPTATVMPVTSHVVRYEITIFTFSDATVELKLRIGHFGELTDIPSSYFNEDGFYRFESLIDENQLAGVDLTVIATFPGGEINIWVDGIKQSGIAGLGLFHGYDEIYVNPELVVGG